MITRLKPGHVDVVLANGERQQFWVSGGMLEVQPQVVTVLADTAARAADLDEASAQRAKKEAEDALANRTDAMEIAEAQAKLVRGDDPAAGAGAAAQEPQALSGSLQRIRSL